ncbi:hypothetical protein GCM10010293_60330 [Streptomyces griseoflavus]|nr:hypothetical protein GCM10010293_60330 [Streptomyces griseoflavus]
MVSSHTLWQDMQAATQSCVSLLIGSMVGCWVMVPPGAKAGAGARPPLLSSYAPRPMSTTGTAGPPGPRPGGRPGQVVCLERPATATRGEAPRSDRPRQEGSTSGTGREET